MLDPLPPVAGIRGGTDDLLLWQLGSEPRTSLRLLSPGDRQAAFDLVTSAYSAGKEIEGDVDIGYELEVASTSFMLKKQSEKPRTSFLPARTYVYKA